ncbi:extracellular solute-binding protein [Phytomonospora sp. NPDC050363]|uniref:extracellular solute-binding protein n=1 Tax=Phytomonospora sp. NPDC050363 TaxID=3155642 RepID=UPI0033C6907E
MRRPSSLSAWGPARRAGRVLALAGLTALVATGCLGGGDDEAADPNKNAGAGEFTLTITSNAIAGGKNAEGADFLTGYVIPKFVEQQKAKGVTAHIEFEPNGVDDAEYKSKIGLDLEAGKGADIIDIDGIWVGEFAASNFIKPLEEVVGADAANNWDGWGQIQPSVQQNASYEGKRYGIPSGTDGRVLYFHKEVFAEAGLPADWQPTSWQDVLDAAGAVADKTDAIPLQLNAGTAMGEATTMQGFLPMLAGTGKEILTDGKWQGDTPQVRQVLDFYQQVYGGELGDATLQQEAKGRDKSFEAFSKGRVGILLESDYLWRGVLSPSSDVAPMPDRDEAVGWAKIPAFAPGAGVGGQDFVSMSGGAAQVLNPNTAYPQQAWELMRFMASAETVKELVRDSPRITQRDDVNAEVLAGDPMLSFIASQVVPLTRFRPGDLAYLQVSTAIQEATYAIVDGSSVEEAAAAYQKTLEGIVGGERVASG